MPQQASVRLALEEGARRSREACTLPERERDRFSLAAPRPEALTPEVLWRRFKWPLIGLGMFLLVELLSLGKLVSIMGRHF